MKYDICYRLTDSAGGTLKIRVHENFETTLTDSDELRIAAHQFLRELFKTRYISISSVTRTNSDVEEIETCECCHEELCDCGFCHNRDHKECYCPRFVAPGTDCEAYDVDLVKEDEAF